MHPGFAGPAPSHILSQIPWLGADASAIDGMTPEIKDEMYRQMGAAIADERKPRKTQGPPGLLSTNRTLYVNNLNEKVQLDQLKLDICELFGSFGEVISVTAMNSFWRRGQAFVLMDSLESASKALEGLQGFEYQGKCMRVNYAREKAHKETGAAPSQRTAPLKPRGVIAREEALRERLRNIQMCAASGKTEELKAEEAAPAVSVADFFHDRLGVNQNKKLPENATDTLHIADVPPEVPESKIRMLFRQFPGFDETQFSMAEGRAEAVYASSAAAATAYNALRNFEVTRACMFVLNRVYFMGHLDVDAQEIALCFAFQFYSRLRDDSSKVSEFYKEGSCVITRVNGDRQSHYRNPPPAEIAAKALFDPASQTALSGRVQLDAVVGHPTVDNGVLALFVGRLLNESFARVFTQTVVLARPDPDQLDFVVVNDIISWSPETSKPCSYEAQYPVSIRPRAFREVQTVKEEVTAEPDSYLTRVLKTENSTEKRARPREQPSDNTTRERVLWISTVPEAYVDSQIKRDVEAFGRRTLSKPVYVEELRRFESKHAVYVLLSDASTARRLMKKTFFWSEAASVEARIGRARSNPFERVIEP